MNPRCAGDSTCGAAPEVCRVTTGDARQLQASTGTGLTHAEARHARDRVLEHADREIVS